ncbi:MAG: HAMP domain-containing sensor histidine kinase [Bacteroidia bacterium]
MSIYNRKQRWKLWLAGLAVIIVGASLWYTNILVKKVSEEERKKVELWADAVRNRAQLVRYTESLFERLKTEERKRVEIWAEATRNLSITNDDDARSFYLKVVSENNTIPAIIVDQDNKINYISNFDTTGFENTSKFNGDIRKEFLDYKPIVFDDGFSNIYYIYYRDSKVFTELREVLNDIIKSFISEVVVNAASVPVIVADSLNTKIIASGNLDAAILNDTLGMLRLTRTMAASNVPLQIELPDHGKCSIYYQNSLLLTQLKFYPVIQFIVIALFLIIAYFLFNFSRRAEQNQVWVGMSKETAHQLGTPLSSLIAWIEILRMKGIDEETLGEMGKDIKRLEVITERFSKIGSIPELQEQNLEYIINESVAYMQPRISKKINLKVIRNDDMRDILIVKINIPLFDWVIENLFRNAIDAMEGGGELEVNYGDKGKYIYIDIHDTGKGIPKSMLNTVFEPGYTSKKRGWGLGLSLAKRIINEYHNGKIFVKKSELGKGTTFRIQLPKSQ